MTDPLVDLIASPPRPQAKTIVLRHLVKTQRALIENARIPVTCHTYSNGGEVWVSDEHPHVTGYSEIQLVARLRHKGLFPKEDA